MFVSSQEKMPEREAEQGVYPEKVTVLKDTCTPMFIAALFRRAKI